MNLNSMALSLRLLDDVQNVNSFEPVQRLFISVGDPVTVYFQVINTSLDRADQGFYPAGRRYVPAPGATMSVTFDNIDDARKVTRAATQPFAQDPSIWSVSVLGSDPVLGTVNIKFTLTEGATVRTGFLAAALSSTTLTGTCRL